jgi:hypothetical protein
MAYEADCKSPKQSGIFLNAIGSVGIGSDSTEPNYRPFFLTVGLSPPPPQ